MGRHGSAGRSGRRKRRCSSSHSSGAIVPGTRARRCRAVESWERLDDVAEALHWMPAWRLREMIGAREISPVELMQHPLDRIERLEPTLHSMITAAGDQAMDTARAAEDSIMRGESLGLLHGIPLSVKDLVATKGIRTTFGSRLYEDHVPDVDSSVCERARAAGAIIVGKTNTPEFGLYGRAINLVADEGVNPWDTERVAGGSSGGSRAEER